MKLSGLRIPWQFLRRLGVVALLLQPTWVFAETYQIPMEISIPMDSGKAANKLVLGVHPEASSQFDPAWDTPTFFSVPIAQDVPPLQAYVRHPEYAENQRQLWRDIRSDAGTGTQSWDLLLAVSPEVSLSGRPVTVAWTLPPSLASSKSDVTLTDATENKTLDMKTQSSYTFVNPGSSSPKLLSVRVTSSPDAPGKSSAGSGTFGCGMIQPRDSGPSSPGTSGLVLVNALIGLLLWLSPVLIHRSRIRSTSTYGGL